MLAVVTQKLISIHKRMVEFHRHISFDHRLCVVTSLQISLFAVFDSIIKTQTFKEDMEDDLTDYKYISV